MAERTARVLWPWPMVMDFADALDRDGYTQLAREARREVWLAAERVFHFDGSPNATGVPVGPPPEDATNVAAVQIDGGTDGDV